MREERVTSHNVYALRRGPAHAGAVARRPGAAGSGAHAETFLNEDFIGGKFDSRVMAKAWQCTRCGFKVETGIQDSLSGYEPGECDNCGNGTFEELRVTGSLHRTVEGSGGAFARQSTRRRVLQAAGGGVLVAGGSWWAFGRPTVESTTEVSMHDSQFYPRNIEVETGATVTWANDADSGEGDPISFFLRSATDGWEFQAEVPEDESVSHTFEESGVYALYAEGLGQPDLSGMSMKVGVGESVDDPVGGWF